MTAIMPRIEQAFAQLTEAETHRRSGDLGPCQGARIVTDISADRYIGRLPAPVFVKRDRHYPAVALTIAFADRTTGA